MKSLVLSICIVWAMASIVSATVINVPGQYATIQEGINAATEGDTVLVHPGTYTENIIIMGRNILLCSMFLPTGDTAYINSTIIDGDLSGTAVWIEQCPDSNMTITGFNIRNGNSLNGGGIYCWLSNPTISYNKIKNNSSQHGGGIYLWQSNPFIYGNIISANEADNYGGGVRCYYSDPLIKQNIIFNNKAHSGGAISCFEAEPEIVNNTIIGNEIDGERLAGGGIYCRNNSHPDVRNTILWGNKGGEISLEDGSITVEYTLIRGGWEGPGNLDINPLLVDPYRLNFNICTASPCLDSGDPAIMDPDSTRSDIGCYFPDHPEIEFGNVRYISVSGNDTTGDGSYNNPFRTIQHGIDIAYHRDTVLVLNGVYVENIDYKLKCIVLGSNYLYSQDTLDISNTVIDGDSSGITMYNFSCDSLTELAGLTITNGFVESWGSGIYCRHSAIKVHDNFIIDNVSVGYGGGVCLFNGDGLITGNRIESNDGAIGAGILSSTDHSRIIDNDVVDNNGYLGGGICCFYSSPEISSNYIYLNRTPAITEGGGGGIYCYFSEALIRSNVIDSNFGAYGGGIYLVETQDSIIDNEIISNWCH